MRVFYDIDRDFVEILGIVAKEDAQAWLARYTEEDS